MKIRVNYVSNSSSSSWVCVNFNKEHFMEVLDEYINTLELDELDKEYYTLNKPEIKKCIITKLNKGEDEQKELLDVYVKTNIVWLYFWTLFTYYTKLRNFELCGCSTCSEEEPQEDCNDCYWYWVHKDLEQYLEELASIEKLFPVLKDYPERDEIKSIVNAAELHTSFKSPVVKEDWERWYKYLDEITEKHYEEILSTIPNAFVFSFASDDGDETEAMCRMTVNKLKDFMSKKDLEGFVGENS